MTQFTSENFDQTFTSLTRSGETLKGLYFENCLFKRCQFIETVFNQCVFEDCRFEQCDLSLIQVGSSSFIETSFLECKCIGINWTVASQRFSPRFEKCQMSHSSFLDRKLTGLILKGCTAKEVNFSGAKLAKAVFTGTDFEKAVFNQTELKEADFRQAQNYDIDVRNNPVVGARFSFPEVVRLVEAFQIKIE
jgi:uncharacterized protein YjbI with pentapeptide repeats